MDSRLPERERERERLFHFCSHTSSYALSEEVIGLLGRKNYISTNVLISEHINAATISLFLSLIVLI